MKVLIENDYIKVVHTGKQDVSFVIEAEYENENSQYVGQWTFDQHVNALENEDIRHLIIKRVDGKSIGYVIIKGLASQNDSIELMRIVIVEKGYGYGKMVISLLKKWCFEVNKSHRLWLDVRENNVRARYVYESQGFVPEGILRECIKVGNTYQSLIVMSILSQDYNISNCHKTKPAIN